MQRFFDIVLSSSALIIFSTVLLPLMLVLRLTGEGEVFFLQHRVGKGGKTFKLYKFATMLKNSPNMATGTVTIKYDPRILPMGRILRTTKINEVPQLINVIKGEMSIIGPRPQTQRCFEAYPKASQNELIRVLPGLSGIGSILFRNEQDMLREVADADEFYDNVIMPYKGMVEEWYVSHRNIFYYFLIIVTTMFVVLGLKPKLVTRLFHGLPSPPKELDRWM